MTDTVTAPAVFDEAGTTPATRTAAPLFRLDPGWMFVLAGLAVCVAGVLLPAQADLHALRQQLSELQTEEARWYARLKAHGDFLDQVDREDPDLVRRLAAMQLNMIPTSEIPVLLAPASAPPLSQWIESSAGKVEPSPVKPLPISSLSRLANGPDRLWLFAGGIMCVFIGLLMGPGVMRARQSSAKSESLVGDDGFENGPLKLEAVEQNTAIAVLDADPIDPDDGELLSAEQVQSNVLVEVPPASRTMEAKILPNDAAHDAACVNEATSMKMVDTAPSVEAPPCDDSAPHSCLRVARDQDSDEDPVPSGSTESNKRDDSTSPSNLEAGDDDDDDADEERWPLIKHSHRSNRFEDSDEPHERSSRD